MRIFVLCNEVSNKYMNYTPIYTINVKRGKRINCNLSLKRVTFIDEDDEGTQYRKTIKYMPNSITIGTKLLSFLETQPKYVRQVVTYITEHLVYNQTVIELINKDISQETGVFPGDVTKAINILCFKEEIDAAKTEEEKEQISLNAILRRMRTIKGYENDTMFSKYEYFVNPAYMYNGSINYLIKK